MLRHSKDEYTDFSRRPSNLERIANRLIAREQDKASQDTCVEDATVAEEDDEPAITAEVEITFEDLLAAHDQWQEESPEDPEAIHRLVDKLWSEKKDAANTKE